MWVKIRIQVKLLARRHDFLGLIFSARLWNVLCSNSSHERPADAWISLWTITDIEMLPKSLKFQKIMRWAGNLEGDEGNCNKYNDSSVICQNNVGVIWGGWSDLIREYVGPIWCRRLRRMKRVQTVPRRLKNFEAIPRADNIIRKNADNAHVPLKRKWTLRCSG